MKKIILFIALAIISVSCTNNQRAKSWGGTEGMVLKPNEVLLNITWKAGDDLWVLTKDTTTNIEYFREHSSWGVWEGEIIIQQPISQPVQQTVRFDR